jgi:hypothetical protein
LQPARILSHAAVALVLAGIGGCASTPPSPPVAAPRLVVGDRWQYQITDNLRRGALARLDAEVTAVAGTSARIRFDYSDDFGRTQWVDELDGQGGLSSGVLGRASPRTFDPPAQLFAFPLEPGKTWRQVINTFRKDLELDDQILIYGRVDGRASASAPAGSYSAVYVYRIVQLDDEEFWRTRTTRRDAIWYAPEIKAPVREAREAEYTEIDGVDSATIRTESRVFELISFRPGPL